MTKEYLKEFMKVDLAIMIAINRREFNMGISIEHVLVQLLRDSQVQKHLQFLQGNSLAVIRVHFLEFDIRLIQMQLVDTQIIRDFYI